MLKAVIFDFDGVIADAEPLHYSTFRDTLSRHYNVDLPEERYYAKYLGYTDIECARAVSTDFALNLDDAGIYELVHRKTAIFKQLAKTQTTIIPGAPDCVHMLSKNHIPTAICSGAFLSDIHLMLKNTDLDHSFDIIVAADHTEKGKPDPQGLFLTLDRLNKASPDNILPTQCVFVEDSRWGLEAAKAAGIHRVAVTNTYPAEELKEFAEKVVNHLSELTITDLQSLCAG